MKRILTLIVFSIFLISCKTDAEKFVLVLEDNHNKEQFLEKDIVQFNLELEFGGKVRFDGTITSSTNSRYCKLEHSDGTVVYYRDDSLFYPPEAENIAKLRFDSYTWPYFFLFPYKLSDEGTLFSALKNRELNGLNYESVKLEFENGVGDSPEDWYIIYEDPDSDKIQYAAYIVTASMTVEEAEKDPHAIEYLDYQTIDYVPIAHEWIFWEWREDEGLTRELGSAEISGVRFLEGSEILFEAPANYQVSTGK